VNDQTDSQLLRAYAEHRSEPAFAELVRRYVDFVYSAAQRMVCNSHLAEDVAQSVFVALAKNAAQLTHRPVLSGWLHRTAQNIAAQTVRSEVRRRAREQEAAAMNALLATEPDALWANIAPHLDAALGELSEPDRDALLLRYFERKSAREMAQTLGTSEEAAQKRVSRAVERLREFFAKRGVTVGASGLVVVISANAVQAAPVGLAVTISTAAALAGTTIATTATATTIKTIAMTTLQKTLVTAVITAAVGTGIYQARQVSTLRSQIQSLQQQQAPLAEQIQQLTRDYSDATNRLAALNDDNERLNRNPGELLKLREEVTRLRHLQNDLATGLKPTTQREESPSGLPEWKLEQLTNVGRTMPHDALQTFLWASANTNLTELANCIVPDAGDPPSYEAIQSYVEDTAEHLLNEFRKFSILSQTNISADEVQLELQAKADAGGFSKTLMLRNVYGEWKVVLFTRRDADGKAYGVHLDIDTQ
jgi:RNA polymerase sigma factor (sigma-70 family)